MARLEPEWYIIIFHFKQNRINPNIFSTQPLVIVKTEPHNMDIGL